MQDRIRSLLPEMPSAVARVAAYLLEHPQAPLTLSIGAASKRGPRPRRHAFRRTMAIRVRELRADRNESVVAPRSTHGPRRSEASSARMTPRRTCYAC